MCAFHAERAKRRRSVQARQAGQCAATAQQTQREPAAQAVPAQVMRVGIQAWRTFPGSLT